MNIFTSVNNENPTDHWKYINVKNKIVLDLGCGRWEKIESRDQSWLTTPEYFLTNNAKEVVAIDADPDEIRWFQNKFKNNPKLKFLLLPINSTADINKLYNLYKPDCVKCDIETNEKFLVGLTEEQFCSVKEYYIETHGNHLYSIIYNLLIKYNYSIRHLIDLTHTKGYCKVIFATKK